MKKTVYSLLLIASLTLPNLAAAKVYTPPPPHVAAIITHAAKRYGVSPKVAFAVAWCESRYVETARHLNTNGTHDVGLFQINDVHIPTLQRLGLTRYDYEENATFAMKLISQHGLSDFSGSSACWSPIVRNTA